MAAIAPVNGMPISSPIRSPGMGGASNGQAPAGTLPGVAPISNPTQIAQQNPYAPTAGGIPTVAGLPPGTQQTNNVNWADGSNTVTGDLKDTLGAGTGTAVSGVLSNLGTSNDAAIQALISNTNLEAGKQYADIQAQQAASGITPDSSSAALAAGDFYSTVNSNLQSTVAQMENQQESTLLQTLLSTGEQHGPDETTLQHITDAFPILNAAGSAAGAASQAFGVGGATGSILDVLGALAL